MVVYYRAKTFKAGYSVSKKNGGAVVRNRIKRILRAVVREYRGYFKDNYYLVIVPKPDQAYNYQDLKAEFYALLKKERILSEPSVATDKVE